MEEKKKELNDLVARYGNTEISRLYAEQQIANRNIKASEQLAIICRALISATQNIKPKSVFAQLDKDTFVLQLQMLEATALESINVHSKPKVSEEVPVVKVEKIESEQALNVAATFWGAVTSFANTIVEAASPPMERRPPPPLTPPPTPKVSPRVTVTASKEILSEVTEKTSPPVQMKQPEKKKKKKKTSRLVTIENPKSQEEIEAERAATQEQARLAQEKSVREVEQTKASFENTQAEIKKISEQLVEYEAKPLGGATRQTLKELQRSVNAFEFEIPAEFKEKLASFAESVLLEESLQKYSDSIQQWKATLPVREETREEAREDNQAEVDEEFEQEMARSEVEVEELPPEIPVASSVDEKLQESRKHFESTLETQKEAFLTALDKQLTTKRESAAAATRLNPREIQTLEIQYAISKVSDDFAQTAVKKWWDFPAIRAVSDFISTKIAGIPPYQERVAHLQQQLISAKSVHDLTEVLAQPKTTGFEHRITVEFAIGKFDMDKAGEALLSTLMILEKVQSGIAAVKKVQPEPTPEKKRSPVADIVERIAKGAKIEKSQDKPRPK